MTDHDAQLALNEHRAVRPSFVRQTRRYTIRADGRVEIERAVGTSGLRWTYECTVARDSYALPSDIRFPVNPIDAAHGDRLLEATHD